MPKDIKQQTWEDFKTMIDNVLVDSIKNVSTDVGECENSINVSINFELDKDDVEVYKEKTPAEINLDVGGKNYKAFVKRLT